jgi:heme exporter protein CcmD
VIDLLAMGGYGPYVWGCFGLTFGVLIFNEWRASRRQADVIRLVRIAVHAQEGRE